MTESVAAGALSSKEVRAQRKARKIEIAFDTNRLLVNRSPSLCTFKAGDVEGWNASLIEVLNKIRLTVQKEGIDLRQIKHTYLTDLSEIGQAMYNNLLPAEAQKRLNDLETKEEQRGGTISLNFQTPPEISPLWELVYGVDSPDQLPPPNPADPVPYLKKFWGFRYPIGHTFELTEAFFPEDIYPNVGLLTAIHDGLAHSRHEVESVASQIEPLGLQCHPLDQKLNEDAFSSKELLRLFTNSDFPYGLIHFACHCENPDGKGVARAILFLKANQCEMDLPLRALVNWQKTGFQSQPLVFLNACETKTSRHLLETISFPISFLNFKAGGVIATACIMPDKFAHDFAVEFYKRLVTQARSGTDNFIAKALLETRLYFLETYHNPLGLAYGLYADAALKLMER
jgi:hypothetical protein